MIEYPKHNHPHGIENTHQNKYRIWVCSECLHIFADDEIRDDSDKDKDWGHPCKLHPCRKGQRCEAHLEPYSPSVKVEMEMKG